MYLHLRGFHYSKKLLFDRLLKIFDSISFSNFCFYICLGLMYECFLIFLFSNLCRYLVFLCFVIVSAIILVFSLYISISLLCFNLSYKCSH
jgi:hypothetical protein